MNEPSNKSNPKDATPDPSDASLTQSSMLHNFKNSTKWRKHWLWVVAVALIAIVGFGSYMFAQGSSTDINTEKVATNNSNLNTDSSEEMLTESESIIQSEEPEGLAVYEPYNSVSVFRSTLLSSVTFNLPDTMDVSETNNDGIVTIGITVKSRRNPIIAITNNPWGCTGPSGEIPRQYDMYLGENPVKMYEACTVISTGVTATGLGENESGSIMIPEDYYEKNKQTIDMILMSMTGVSERKN